MRRVPLEAALRGGVSVESLPALRHDLKSLRTFLEPWLITKGADPKAACKDLKAAAKKREQAAARHAPAEALPPPPKVVVPDEIISQYDEQAAAVVPLIKNYLKRAMASKPKLEGMKA